MKLTIVEIKKGDFISDELRTLIEGSRGKVAPLLITARKGFAPLTVCGDCGSILNCALCDVPLTLRRGSRDSRVYACNYCDAIEPTTIACRQCGSWKLTMLGVGTERVSELTAHTVHTPAHVYALKEPVENAAVVSIESLFALPSYRMSEETLRLLITLKSITLRQLIIQTRKPKDMIFEFLRTGDIDGFKKYERERRRRFDYPPFTVVIKILHRGNALQRANFERFATLKFKKYNPIVTPAFVPKIRNMLHTVCVLKVPSGEWPEGELCGTLRALRKRLEIFINPENLL